MSASRLRNRLLLGFACFLAASSAARADIVYTWQDDDHSGTTGFIQVVSSAQDLGHFNFDDIVHFAFQPNVTWHDPFFTLSPGEIPISHGDAGFTASNAEIISGNALGLLTVDLDSNFGVVNGEHWSVASQYPSYVASGTGHWSISGAVAAVPEPSAFALLGVGVIGAVAWRLTNRRKSGIVVEI